MNKKDKSSDLDELQNSIDEAAAKATKIKVTSSDDATTGEGEEKTEPNTSVDEATSSEDEAEENTSLDKDEEKRIQEEIEKEFEQEEVTELADEPKAKAGPAGPYVPVVPDSEDDDTEEIDDSTEQEKDESEDESDDEAEDDQVELIDQKDEATASDEPAKEAEDALDDEANDEKVAEPASDDEAVDELLSVEPRQAQAAAAEAAQAASQKNEKKKRFPRIRKFFHGWWNNKRLRYATFFGLFVALTAVILIPTTRYATLNLFGVRVSTSLQIIDSETRLPLENIPVSLAESTVRSNEDGYVEFKGAKLGATVLTIDKLGYAKVDRQLTLGFGSNPLGPQQIVATGEQFRFTTTDWLGKSIINDAEALSGEDIAKSNEEGVILLTVGDLSDGAEVRIRAPGYRDEVLALTDLNQGMNEVVLVPGKKHVFVSNRSGEYDLYKIDVDGDNEEVILEATGKEREIPFVLPHQEKNIAAYISSRDGERNSGGFVLDGLFIVDVETNEAQRVYRSEQLQIIGWVDSKLIYVAVVEGVSASNSQRSKVFSYDLDKGERYELAAANYFNDVKIVSDKVYYSVSSAAVPQSQAKLYRTDVEGLDKELVVDTQVWSILREDYETLLFSSADREWYRQIIGQEVEKLENQPTTRSSRTYATAPNNLQSVWVDIRDGKGVLLKYSIESNQDETILTSPGLSEPVYWINDSYVVYRVTTSDETADYVLHIDDREPQKIADVVGNQSRFFY